MRLYLNKSSVKRRTDRYCAEVLFFFTGGRGTFLSEEASPAPVACYIPPRCSAEPLPVDARTSAELLRRRFCQRSHADVC